MIRRPSKAQRRPSEAQRRPSEAQRRPSADERRPSAVRLPFGLRLGVFLGGLSGGPCLGLTLGLTPSWWGLGCAWVGGCTLRGDWAGPAWGSCRGMPRHEHEHSACAANDFHFASPRQQPSPRKRITEPQEAPGPRKKHV